MTAVAAAPRRATHTHPLRVTFPRLLRSEAIKMLSLRSTWWSLGLTVALSVGMSFLLALVTADSGGAPAATVLLMPMALTMLVAGILGAIVITGEYSTGMIAATLTAEPRRGAVLLAKALVAAAVIAVTTVIGYALAAAVSLPVLGQGIDWSIPSESTQPLILGVASMIAFTLIGLGFGFVLRSSAAAIAATVGVLFVLPIIASFFASAGERWQWILDASQYLPMRAATAVTRVGAVDLLAPGLALVAWVAVPLLLGWAVVRTRDA